MAAAGGSGGGSRAKKQSLGDVWATLAAPRSLWPSPSSSSTQQIASRAFATKQLRSIDTGRGDESVRVCFRNDTPEPLTICWVSDKGKPYHYYELGPWRGAAAAEEGEKKKKAAEKTASDGGGKDNDSSSKPNAAPSEQLLVRKGDHVETTRLGHAFLLARRTDRHLTAKERKQRKEENGGAGAPGSAASGSQLSDAPDILSSSSPTTPTKKNVLDCLSLCSPNRRRLGERHGGSVGSDDDDDGDGNHLVPDDEGRFIDPNDVIGGYRPTKITIEATDEEGETEEHSDDEGQRIHVVTVSRQRIQQQQRGLRGIWGGHKAQDDELRSSSPSCRWTYTVEVTEGKLDRTPLDTSGKVYRSIQLGGWSVRCEEGMWQKKTESDDNGAKQEFKEEARLRELIANDLAAASRCLPSAARKALKAKETPIWINRTQKFGPACAPVRGRGMCFHPDPGWLTENGMSAKKAGGVEMYRVSSYADDRHLWGKGGVLLHELSHAYHHKCVEGGYDNPDVLKCYESAMEKGLYDCVRVHGSQGPECRAYACTDQMEYFAELSVAFLGGLDESAEHNKWFPFNREQLRRHDPDAYEMLKKIWKVE